MDGDTIPEIVLELENYRGYIVLRYSEGDIYGNIVSGHILRLIDTYYGCQFYDSFS